MRMLMILFYLVIILLGVSFSVLNAGFVHLNLYFKTVTIPISVLMFAMLGFGVLLGCVLFLLKYWRLKSECRKLKKQLVITEKEIKNLRTIPLKDQH